LANDDYCCCFCSCYCACLTINKKPKTRFCFQTIQECQHTCWWKCKKHVGIRWLIISNSIVQMWPITNHIFCENKNIFHSHTIIVVFVVNLVFRLFEFYSKKLVVKFFDVLTVTCCILHDVFESYGILQTCFFFPNDYFQCVVLHINTP